MKDQHEQVTVAQTYLRLLADRGVDYLFANAGTDFASIIEAYAVLGKEGVPVPVTVPHENVAIHMAIGYWMISGRMQAVMVHVNVGTANAICGILNAARCHVPVLFTAGRTPITERGERGSRNLHIHWTQEMFDQAGMVREAVKWEYELRTGSQLVTVVDRALAIADSAPKGPVYLTLPREVLAGRGTAIEDFPPPRHGTTALAAPGRQAMQELVSMFTAARLPVIITSGMALEPGGAEALAAFAQKYAVPVIQFVPRCASLPSRHSMHAGYDPVPWIGRADLILVLDSAVPWIPEHTDVSHVRIVQIAADPIHADIPIRGFECDLAIAGSPAEALAALHAELDGFAQTVEAEIAERRVLVEKQIGRARDDAMELVEHVKDQTPIHPAWFSHCINLAKGENSILVKEAPQLALAQLDFVERMSLVHAGAAGGLGWGLGAALGAKLAAPEKLVIAVEGDGSYMFCTPVAAHYVALEQDAPFLTVIFNNRSWNEVRAATRHVYPEGAAARDGSYEPLTDFHPSLQLHKVVEAAGGYGEQVSDPRELPAALARAIAVVKNERRQAVLDVICAN
ncbi:MAG: thiamine pyrophosphate-requiring protein [Pigmentiphaga sp.]